MGYYLCYVLSTDSDYTNYMMHIVLKTSTAMVSAETVVSLPRTSTNPKVPKLFAITTPPLLTRIMARLAAHGRRPQPTAVAQLEWRMTMLLRRLRIPSRAGLCKGGHSESLN